MMLLYIYSLTSGGEINSPKDSPPLMYDCIASPHRQQGH